MQNEGQEGKEEPWPTQVRALLQGAGSGRRSPAQKGGFAGGISPVTGGGCTRHVLFWYFCSLGSSPAHSLHALESLRWRGVSLSIPNTSGVARGGRCQGVCSIWHSTGLGAFAGVSRVFRISLGGEMGVFQHGVARARHLQSQEENHQRRPWPLLVWIDCDFS